MQVRYSKDFCTVSHLLLCQGIQTRGASDILFLSGDDDLFEWDEDDMPAKPNEKSSAPNVKVSLLNHNLILYGIRKTNHIFQERATYKT